MESQHPHQHQHGELQVARLAEEESYEYEPPMGVPLPSMVRRLPPPCWTPDETSCLIDSYRSKWLSLHRSNLRSSHWHDVAHHIHSRCPHVSPPKTAVQCRHKMEKLRKRYRAELLRANSIPHHRFKSSWIYFSKMESIDKPSSPLPISHAPAFQHSPLVAIPQPQSQSQSQSQSLSQSQSQSQSNTASAGPSSNNYMNPTTIRGFHDNNRNNSPNAVKLSKSKLDEAAFEMAHAIKMVAQGFVRMEHMKMDMMREAEHLRVDMEINRTKMLLDSQHRILHAFSQGCSDIIHNQHPSSS